MIATTIQSSNSSSNFAPSSLQPAQVVAGAHSFYSGSNQIVNGGQHLKELNYITTEYVKDKNVLDDRRQKSISYQQHHNQQQTKMTQDMKSVYNEKEMSLSNRYKINRQQQQHKNNTNNNKSFSDNKSNDRYKSNLKSIKRHAQQQPRGEDANRVPSSFVNETKHVNFDKRNLTSSPKNQYSSAQPTFSHLRSSSQAHSDGNGNSGSSSVSKYHMTSAISSHSYNNHNANINSNNNNNLYANTVHTETVEQPTLMELECIAGL